MAKEAVKQGQQMAMPKGKAKPAGSEKMKGPSPKAEKFKGKKK